MKNISTFLPLFYIRRKEVAFYFAVFKNNTKTRFAFLNCTEIKFADVSRINIVEIISRLFLNQNRARWLRIRRKLLQIRAIIEKRYVEQRSESSSRRRNEIRKDSERCRSTGNDRVGNEDIHLLRRRNLNGLFSWYENKEHLAVERSATSGTETEVGRRGKWEYPYVERDKWNGDRA